MSLLVEVRAHHEAERLDIDGSVQGHADDLEYPDAVGFTPRASGHLAEPNASASLDPTIGLAAYLSTLRVLAPMKCDGGGDIAPSHAALHVLTAARAEHDPAGGQRGEGCPQRLLHGPETPTCPLRFL